GVKGVTVNLFDENGVVQSTTTDDAGTYRFDGLDPAKYYHLQFIAPNGWQAEFTSYGAGGVGNSATDSDVYPLLNGMTLPFIVDANTYDNTWDAGLLYGSAGGTVWVEKDADGMLKTDEPGRMAGLKVELYDQDGKRQTATTDAGGNYHFDGLDPS